MQSRPKSKEHADPDMPQSVICWRKGGGKLRACQPEGPHPAATATLMASARHPRRARRSSGHTCAATGCGGVSFRRQHAIGRYVVDFCSARHRLIIELDGGAHLEQTLSDSQRTAALRSRGYRVLRFWNHQVMNDIDGVSRAILDALNFI